MHAVVKSLATRVAPISVRSFATVGPGAVLHRAGSANTPSEAWLKETAARKTPFDDYTFAYVASSSSQPETRVMTHCGVVCLSFLLCLSRAAL